ncbi:hypothetical protein K432DRAFT_439051 [Lepidopterella palustris CBS 459.81]|uniref:Uncharacterized protein n=1 Tax=Lepidopterella palustris CBS 459.81 TaxID=1314670 RepID=A0A8E2EKW3_9PEZI|nr:hypothetical protein K432DRAFT_439051 [Lepidopterella palustris CBS 459.81]
MFTCASQRLSPARTASWTLSMWRRSLRWWMSPGCLVAYSLRIRSKNMDVMMPIYNVSDKRSFDKLDIVRENVVSTLGEGFYGDCGDEGGFAERRFGVEGRAGEGREFAGRVGGTYCECSVKYGQRVQEAINGLVKAVLESRRLLGMLSKNNQQESRRLMPDGSPLCFGFSSPHLRSLCS